MDVDGVVINRQSCRKGFAIVDPKCVEQMNLLLERTGAQLVISSSWRIGRTVPELQKMMDDWGVKGKVLDKTPHTNYSDERGTEIAAWLTDAREKYKLAVTSFIILDDDADMGHLLSHLIHTRFEPGLTANDVEMAIRMFEKLEKHKDPAVLAGSV